MKKALLALLAAATLLLVWDIATAPVFWQRMAATFTAAGKGAASDVFDVRETVRGRPGAGALPVAAPDERSVAADALEDVVAYAEAYDSFSLLVLHRGVVQLEWYREGYSAASLTQSQSMHKSIQAMLIGRAIEDGLIGSVDDRLGAYLPELADDPRGDITLAQLLHMSSGLQNFSASFHPWSDAFRWLYAEDTRAATLAFPQLQPAGQVFDYNDLNAQLLGLVLTEVTGKRYAELLSETLWRPLGNDDAQVWLDHEGGEAMHACCLLATSRDWARVGLMLQRGGIARGQQLVSEDWLAAMTTASPQSPHYGYQTWLADNNTPNPRKTGYQRRQPWLAEDVYYFSGYGAQRVYISAEKELVIVRLGPAAGYFPKIVEEWDNSYLFNRVVQGILP